MKTETRNLIGKITHETFVQQRTDAGIQKSIISRLHEVYGNSDEKKSIIRRLERNERIVRIPIRSNYKRPSSISLPWIDGDLHNRIRNSDISLTAPIPDDIGEADFIRSLKQAVGRYTVDSRKSSRRNIQCITSAGLCAARALGLIEGKPANTVPLEFAVNETARNSNSGWPLFKRKNSTQAKADTLEWMKNITNRPTVYSVFNNPILFSPVIENPSYKFNRTQPKIDEKNFKSSWSIREVWCLPYRIIALECYFFYDLIQRYKYKQKNSLRPLTNAGLDTDTVGIRIVKRLRDKLNLNSGECIYSNDYSKFDSTIPSVATDVFYNICRSELNLSKSDEALFNILRYYTKKTPTVIEDEVILFSRGMSSGSYITHIFDTWWNLTLWYLSYHAMNQDRMVTARVVDGYEYKSCLQDPIYDKPFEYGERDDIALCGDDTLIYTSYDEICIHRNICKGFDMEVNVGMKTCDPNGYIYFLGGYWNSSNKRVQTAMYITLHIIARTKYYTKKDKLPFPIKELDFHRILSICQDLDNGWEYINKAFKKWKAFQSFLYNNNYYFETRDYPQEEYLEPKQIKFQSV